MLVCPSVCGVFTRSRFLQILTAFGNRNEFRQINRSIFSGALHTHLLKTRDVSAFGHSLFGDFRNENLSNEVVICYVDASCINNGKAETVAGIGVFWGDEHEDNVSESLGVAAHTSNRAKMMAVVKALEIALEKRYRHILIRTDYELIVKIMNEWLQQWKNNNWRRVNNGPIKNLDLIQRIDHLCTSIGCVSFEHVKGRHKKAHSLANQAMKQSRLFMDLNDIEVNVPDYRNAVEEAKKRAKELLTQKEELRRLIGYIDLTTLSGDDRRSVVEKLVDRAVQPWDQDKSVHCAAVCVYPARILDAVNRLKTHPNNKVHVASVVGGFPSGQYHLQSRLLEIELAIRDGADELDTVINRGAALDSDWKTVHDELVEMKRVGGSAHLKVILAVGELKTDENIYRASMVSMIAGADFIKTSTGKETVNATLESTFVMCQAIKDYYAKTGRRVGFKPAGGIKTAEEALSYVALIEKLLGPEWLTPNLFRIGASSLLDSVLNSLKSL